MKLWQRALIWLGLLPVGILAASLAHSALLRWLESRFAFADLNVAWVPPRWLYSTVLWCLSVMAAVMVLESIMRVLRVGRWWTWLRMRLAARRTSRATPRG